MLFTTTILLLSACASLPSSFASGTHALLPTVQHDATRRSAVIRGLLEVRQGVCSPGFVGCSATTCCPTGWNCCSDGNCCDPTTYCVLGTNGVIGCCPLGELCSGPAGDPTTLLPSPTPTPTTTRTPTTTARPTTSVVLSPTTTSVPVPGTQTVQVPTVVTVITQTVGSSSPTTTPGLVPGAAGRAQPYRPLLVIVGILLATLYCV